MNLNNIVRFLLSHHTILNIQSDQARDQTKVPPSIQHQFGLIDYDKGETSIILGDKIT